MEQGSQHSISITSGDYTPDNYAAWIDYDQDEVFEASEKLGEFTNAAVGESQNISFTVPAGAVIGNTVLRVRGVFYNNGEPDPADPCFDYAFGETEDYRIMITSPAVGACVPTSAGGTSDGDFINSVVLEGIQNINSGALNGPSYSHYTDTFSAELAQGGIHGVLVQSGTYTPDRYAVWIDYDQDEVFEASEKLGEFETSAANESRTITFTVPGNAPLGTTVMRVRGVFVDNNEPDPVDPCFNYAFGETEDYGIVIASGPPGYCIPTSLSGTSDGDFINGVSLGSIDNLNSGGTEGPTYNDYTVTFTTNLVRGTEQILVIEGGDYAPDAFAAWIDYDHDEVFETAEKLGEYTTTGTFESRTISFVVPDDAELGATRMRIRGVYQNSGEPDPVDPCFAYGFGETEDYGIIIETSTGIGQVDVSRVNIHPNPTSGTLVVDLDTRGQVQLDLMDAQGRIVQRHSDMTDRIQLDLTALASGTYLVRVQQNDRTSTHRIEVIAGD